MPGSNPVRKVALAGCGAIAPMHVRGLASYPGIELTALVDPQPEAAEEIARSWYRMTRWCPGGRITREE